MYSLSIDGNYLNRILGIELLKRARDTIREEIRSRGVRISICFPFISIYLFKIHFFY